MDNQNLKIISLNTRRFAKTEKVMEIKKYIENHDPSVIIMQEVSILDMYEQMKDKYKTIFTIEQNNTDGVGIMIFYKKDLQVYDRIIDSSGMILGLKLNDTQIWNIYPMSGSMKKEREEFFSDTLAQAMSPWSSSTSNIILGGDMNCTIRLEDSENNQHQHYQEGLVQFLKVFNLSDDYLNIHKDEIAKVYSRITKVSKTRIDIMTSNSDKCKKIKYEDTAIDNLDHMAIVAEYDLDLRKKVKVKWNANKNKAWSFPKELEKDEEFNIGLDYILETIEDRLEEEDPRTLWSETKEKTKNGL